MKRVCVISAYGYVKKNINYGSLFQYYALEMVLKKMGVASYWLRYELPDEKITYTTAVKEIVKRVVYFNHFKKLNFLYRRWSEFVNNKLSLSSETYNDKTINDSIPVADFYITGSDQVWGGEVPANYLCFVPDQYPKISYAASFGTSKISEKKRRTISPWIKKLDRVSVREPSGVELCKEMGVEAMLVLDPTFLIEPENYPEKEVEEFKNKKFIFCYLLNLTDEECNLIKDLNALSKKHDEKIKFAVVNGNSYKYVPKDNRGYYAPDEWIWMYKNANGIVTNTFHGTVFSIMFHKQFVYYEQTGVTKNQNERIISLLNLLGLKNRIVKERNTIELMLEERIDWRDVDRILNKEKEKSIDFLSEALKLLQ